MRLLAILIALAALLSGTGLCAGETLEYDVTGVFSEFTANTPWSAPNEPFEFRFSMDSQPTPVSVGSIWFTVPTSVRYKIGSQPESYGSAEVEFFQPVAFSGGLAFVFNAAEPTESFELGWGGDQLFTGTLDSPSMKAGTFELADATLTVTPTPEPAVTAACAVILIGLLIARRRMRTVNLRKSYAAGSRGLFRSNRPPR